jgi:hypothetical protein
MKLAFFVIWALSAPTVTHSQAPTPVISLVTTQVSDRTSKCRLEHLKKKNAQDGIF